ncbi:MAG TPA: glycoside hydrolase family 3 N-terminal domain-containing protein [Thermoanaerobaculia bacterium]
MSETSRLFGVGISGPELTEREREILREHPPRAVILFARNVASAEQLSRLTAEIASSGAIVCLDQEGGRVDRLREVLGESISLLAATRAGVPRLAGELAGESCARFGVHVDLAPVVDRLLPGASGRILSDRCAAEDPEEVAQAATEFLDGLHSRGVSGCVKHFPGLGRAELDTHHALPRIAEDPDEEARDLAPFAATMELAGAVMVSHAAGPDGTPASLSRSRATGLLREALAFEGAAFTDDLEMGALASFGGLPQRSALACAAGCDLLFVCSRIDEYPSCIREVELRVPPPRRDEAAARLDAWERKVRRLAEGFPVPARPIERLAADIAALRDAAARPA